MKLDDVSVMMSKGRDVRLDGVSVMMSKGRDEIT